LKYKILTLVMAAGIILMMLGMPQTQAASNTDPVLRKPKATMLVHAHSTALWDAEESARSSEKDYQKQVLRSNGIDIQKMFVYYNPFTDEDVYYYFNADEQMQMRLLKEFMPEQMKYVWEIKQKAVEVTKNALANAANDLYYGLYASYNSRLLAEKALETAKKTFEREKARYDNGQITGMDLEGVRLNVKAAENALSKAKRDFDNVHRQFNSLAGLPIDYRFELVVMPLVSGNTLTITEEQALASAMENRMELWDLRRQMELIEKQMEIYRHKDVYKYHNDTKENYRKAEEKLDELRLNLEEKEYAIQKEIRQAYQDLKISFMALEISKANLERQKKKLETLYTQYNSGLIPVSIIEQLEQAISQLEFAVNMNIVSISNKQDKFNRAISAGPGY